MKLSSNTVDVGKRQRIGVCAIREQDKHALVLRIDPTSSARESRVTEAVGTQEPAVESLVAASCQPTERAWFVLQVVSSGTAHTFLVSVIYFEPPEIDYL